MFKIRLIAYFVFLDRCHIGDVIAYHAYHRRTTNHIHHTVFKCCTGIQLNITFILFVSSKH